MSLIPMRWRVAGLLFLAAALNYLDRACLSVVSPAIKQQLLLSDSEMGVVFSSFFAGYALMNLGGGWAADRFGAKRVLSISLVSWSILCASTATVTGFASLLMSRALFGAAEGPFGAVSAAAVNGWFAKREVARALAAVASGTAAGAIVAGPVIALIYTRFGWRGSVVAISSAGLLFALVWTRFAKEAPRASAPVLDVATSTTGSQAVRRRDGEPDKGERHFAVRRYLWHPTIVANALAYFAYTYLLAVYLSWLPLFLTTEFHLRIENAALSSSLPWVMAFVGIWAGTFLADYLFRRNGKLAYSRRLVQVMALATAGAGTAALGLVGSATAATAIASMSLFALFLSGTSFWAVVQDIVAPRAIGTISGFTHFIANIGGIVGPAATGFLVQHSGSFRSAWLAAGLVEVGAVACVLAASQLQTPEPSLDAQAER